MAIDFPNSPTTNQTYSVGGTTWKYDGQKWVITATGIVRGAIGCRLTRTSTFSLTNGSFTTIDFNGETYDTHGFHTGTSSEIVVPAGMSGIYLLNAGVSFNVSGTGMRVVAIQKNGSDITSVSVGDSGGGFFSMGLNTSTPIDADDGDVFIVRAYQNSGGALTALATTTFFSATHIGA